MNTHVGRPLEVIDTACPWDIEQDGNGSLLEGECILLESVRTSSETGVFHDKTCFYLSSCAWRRSHKVSNLFVQ